jgi:hypothetical protein
MLAEIFMLRIETAARIAALDGAAAQVRNERETKSGGNRRFYF